MTATMMMEIQQGSRSVGVYSMFDAFDSTPWAESWSIARHVRTQKEQELEQNLENRIIQTKLSERSCLTAVRHLRSPSRLVSLCVI
jgi:hypothetical protein